MVVGVLMGLALLGSTTSEVDGIRISTATQPTLCNATRVSISPDARWIATWTRLGDIALNPMSPEGGHPVISVVAVDCLTGGDDACPSRTLRVRNSIQALAWTSDDGLAIVTGGGEFVLTSPGGQTIAFHRTLPRGSLGGRFQMIGPFEREAVQRWAAGLGADSDTSTEAVYSVEGRLREARFDRRTLSQIFFENGSLLDPKARSPIDAVHWRETPPILRWPLALCRCGRVFASAVRNFIFGQPATNTRCGRWRCARRLR